jgi:GT2 family glycosyltransferase
MQQSRAISAQPPLVSIVIVTHNARDYAEKCLNTIRAMTKVPYEVIVVDNASQQATRTYLRDEKGINLILNEENRLWCHACNQGIEATDKRAVYLLLLNPDVEVLRPDWLEIMIQVMESDPRVGLVGPQHRYSGVGPVWGALAGHCILLRREMVTQLGRMDCDRFPMGGGPEFYAIRAYKAGWTYKVLHPKDKIVIHHEAKSRQDIDSEPYTKKPRPSYVALLHEVGIVPQYPTKLRRSLDRRFRWIRNYARFYDAPRNHPKQAIMRPGLP